MDGRTKKSKPINIPSAKVTSTYVTPFEPGAKYDTIFTNVFMVMTHENIRF